MVNAPLTHNWSIWEDIIWDKPFVNQFMNFGQNVVFGWSGIIHWYEAFDIIDIHQSIQQ